MLQNCPRSLIFGGTAVVEQYKGNPKVQAHGPGFSKILLGDDKVDQWEKYIDIMADSIYVLEDGAIAESGSHDDLVRLGGKYAHLFEMQAQHYR